MPKLSNIRKINDTKYIKLIIIGRLSKEKGHMHLLEAINIVYKKYKNIILDIYGDGVEKESLIKFVNDNNLNNVVFFKGYKSNIEIDKYDIGLMCSKSEGFGRVTVEYMMNGLAVIGTDSGANPEIIVDNETGLLYKFGNYESLSLKILFLINNVNVLRKYGKLGRKRAIKYFSEETYNKNIYDLCNRIIDGENNEQC